IAAALGNADHDPTTFDAARRLTASLRALRHAVDSARELAVHSIALSGLSETVILEAVETVAGGSAPDQTQPLHSTVERLDLGTLALDQSPRTTFDVTGGPGRIIVESDQLTVEPLQFGPGATRIAVSAAAMPAGGVLLTSLRAVTPAEILEIPLFARWAAQPGAATVRAAGRAAEAAPAPTAPPVIVKTTVLISRVTAVPRALALQRAVQQVAGVAEVKAAGYEQSVLTLQVMHEARVNLVEQVTRLRGFPLRLVDSSLGRLHLTA
ncbi:MAG TPA: hypothetical protein VFX49_15535, partial [Chloroflexota bacterium]|nr:hypothetical protein [Chloroflexota bacterium]